MKSKQYKWALTTLSLAVAATLAACGGGDGGSASSVSGVSVRADQGQTTDQPALQAFKQLDLSQTGPQAPTSMNGLETSQASASGLEPRKLALSPPDPGYVIDTMNREQVKLFYKTVFASSEGVPSGWSGDISKCNAGDTTPEYKDATLRRINWFRAMAGVPAAVKFDAGFNVKAQQAAMMMSANNQLSHTPPVTWTCYNAIGAEAAGKSNIGLGGTGKDAVNQYVRDDGANNTVAGHRRWLLFPQTKLMGTGDAVAGSGKPAASALWVIDSNITTARPIVRDDFVAWPAKGYVPYKTVYPRWSFSYPSADFSKATVSMTDGLGAIPTKIESALPGSGENSIVWLPGSYTDAMVWAKPTVDMTYKVTIDNVLIVGRARTFSYTVTVFDPDSDQGSKPLTISGPAVASVGKAASFAFNPMPEAAGYLLTAINTKVLNLVDGAEDSLVNFTPTTGPEYTVIASDVSASGSKSFHLANSNSATQYLQFKQNLIGTADAAIEFKGLLGWATTAQSGRLEASTDGVSWQTLYEVFGKQNGKNAFAGDTVFATRQVSLAQFAGKPFQLRFRYGLGANTGSFYAQFGKGYGWYIDDVKLTGVKEIKSISAPQSLQDTSFGYTPTEKGDIFLQVRPGLYGYYAEGGPLKTVLAQQPGDGWPVVTDTRDCIMDWAEKTYAGFFSTSAASQTNALYYYRYYPGNVSAMGFGVDDSFNYVAPKTGKVITAGPKSDWMAKSGCK